MSAGVSAIVALRTHAGQRRSTCIPELTLFLQFSLLSEPIDQEQNQKEEKGAAADDDSKEDFFFHNPHFFLLPFRRFVASLVQEFLVDGVEHGLRRAKFIVAYIEKWCLNKTKIFCERWLARIEVK